MTMKRNSSPVKRVVLLGAESSGKTTLAEALAIHYQTLYVPEYFRFYWQARKVLIEREPWRLDDFVHMALMQNVLEEEYAKRVDRLLICDTDAFSVSLWNRRYRGTFDPEVDALARPRSSVLNESDLILFCADDFPFVPDPVRDGEKIRAQMASWTLARLEEKGLPFSILRGNPAKRLAEAVGLIDLRFSCSLTRV